MLPAPMQPTLQASLQPTLQPSPGAVMADLGMVNPDQNALSLGALQEHQQLQQLLQIQMQQQLQKQVRSDEGL